MLISFLLPCLLVALRLRTPPLLTVASNLDKNFLAEGQNLLVLINSTPQLSKFAEIVQKSEVVKQALASENSLTVFAPDNDAFKEHHHKAPEDLDSAILYHLINGVFPASSLTDGKLLESGLTLDTLGVHVSQEGIKLNGHVAIVTSDTKATNGILHTVSSFLKPPPGLLWMALHNAKEFGLFVLAVKRAGLDKVLRLTAHTTLFVPTNSAFKQLGLKKLAFLFSAAGTSELVQILLGHVSPVLLYSGDILAHKLPLVIPTLGKQLIATHDLDGVISVSEAVVGTQDLIAANGVLHGIDFVLGVSESVIGDDAYDSEEWYQILYKDSEGAAASSVEVDAKVPEEVLDVKPTTSLKEKCILDDGESLSPC